MSNPELLVHARDMTRQQFAQALKDFERAAYLAEVRRIQEADLARLRKKYPDPAFAADKE